MGRKTAAKVRTNVVTRPETKRILLDSGNAGEYVEHLVQARREEWETALSVLRKAGLGPRNPGTLYQCLDALNGLPAFPIGLPHRLVRERLRKAKVEPPVAINVVTGSALYVLAREWWAGNEAFRAAL